MKRKLFLRFFSIAIVSVMLMFIFGIVAVNVSTRNVVEERLKEETELASELMNDRSDFALFKKYENNLELRITVFDLEGNVLYESDATTALENHIDREEIQNALNDRPDTVERYSETFKRNMTYYATKSSLSDGTEVILRLAVVSSEVSTYITALIPMLIVVLGLSLIISLVFSSILSEGVSAKVTEIGESLRSLNGGEYIPIKTNATEPELFAVLNYINDLNANIHSQILITEAEKVKLNTVLDNVSQCIIALDGTGKIVFANKSAFSMFEGDGASIGKELTTLIKEPKIHESISGHLGEDYTFYTSYREMELSVVISKVTNNAISDQISAILIVTDITNERLVQKQKSDFFANASHELKTPITVMQGFAEVLMSKDGMDEVSKKQLARIYKESQRLASLISDMLMLSKIESGDSPGGTVSDVSLAEIAREVTEEFAKEIRDKHLTVEINGSARLCADHNMIFELAENLISNAVKYNKDGGTLTVTIADESDAVSFTVSDSGIGIEREHLPRLCERFYRVDKSHSKRIGGTGLGLAIVKHISAAMGAELSIESEFGVGTSVRVLFPKINL